MAARQRSGEAITQPQILSALKRSGYPFEIEILISLERHGLDPVNGFRFRVADGPTRPSRGEPEEPVSALTREIDTMASVHAGKVVPAVAEAVGGPVSARLVAMIEAKSLPLSEAFVAFPVKPPGAQALRGARTRFAGAPCLGPLPGYDEAMSVAPVLSAALDPLNDVPCCIQWAVVEEAKGEHTANHPPRWAAALWNLMRMIHYHARETTEFLLGRDDADARVDFHEPTLFVKTPCLYLFDVPSNTLTPTQHLVLSQYVEVPGGVQQLRLVNVVAYPFDESRS